MLVDLSGDDLILCQITSRVRTDTYSVAIDNGDFDQGRLAVQSYARPNRLFTVEQSVILYSAGKLTSKKLDEVKSKARQLSS